MRFRKSIRLGKGVRLNLGSKSVGLSAGVKGARVSCNTKTGGRATVSAPGTGVSYSTSLNGPRRNSGPKQAVPASPDDALIDYTMPEPLVLRVVPEAHAQAPAIIDPHQAISRFSDFTFPVPIMANSMVWPCACCCCGVRLVPPAGAVEIRPNAHVIKMTIVAWRPTYCEGCARHVQLANEGYAPPPGAFAGCASLGCSPCIWFVSFGVLLSMTEENAGLSFILAAAIASIFIWVMYEAEKKGKEAVEESNRVKQAQAIGRTSERCCHYESAVWISSLYGSIHRFEFRNEAFSKLFGKLNEDKIRH